MRAKFEVNLLGEAIDFIESLDDKTRKKIIFNLDKSRFVNDPKLFKKLNDEIWEFRTKYQGMQYRLLAFWDKRNKKRTLVVATHGIIKKVDKVPKREISKAERIRKEYLK